MLPPLVSLATITLFHLFIVWSHPKNFRTFRPLFNFFYAVCRLFAYRLTQFHLALPFTSFWFRDIDFRFRYSLVIQFVLITIERSENCITVVYRKLKVRFSSGFQLYKSYWVHTNRNLKKKYLTRLGHFTRINNSKSYTPILLKLVPKDLKYSVVLAY